MKIRLLNTIVIPTAIYASETWKRMKWIAQKLNTFQQQRLRRILRTTYHDSNANEEILRRAGARRLEATVTERRTHLAWHILRLPRNQHPKAAMHWIPSKGKRSADQPQATWRRTFQMDLKSIEIRWNDVEVTTENRWRTLAA